MSVKDNKRKHKVKVFGLQAGSRVLGAKTLRLCGKKLRVHSMKGRLGEGRKGDEETKGRRDEETKGPKKDKS